MFSQKIYSWCTFVTHICLTNVDVKSKMEVKHHILATSCILLVNVDANHGPSISTPILVYILLRFSSIDLSYINITGTKNKKKCIQDDGK